MTQPNFWKPSEAKDKHGVVAHTPDPTKYHNTDQIGFEKASHATMIPRARGLMGDGSRGFNHNLPSAKIIVDPGMEGGGFEIDPSKLNSKMVRKAIEQVGGIDSGEDSRESIFSVLQNLNRDAAAATPTVKTAAPALEPAPLPPPVRSNPRYPNSYVAPKSNASGRQLVATVTAPVMETPQTFTPSVTGYIAEPAVPEPSTPVQAQTSQENNMSTTNDQLLHMYAEVLRRLDAVTTVPQELPVANAAPLTALQLENAVVKPTLRTHIDCLDADRVLKPSRNVVFSWNDGGNMSCRYHDVVIGDGCIVLVYDTRYEDGMQWIPPVLNDKATIKLSLREESGKREFEVASLGVSFTLGCLDVIVMMLLEELTPVKQVNPRFAQQQQQED